MGRSPAADACPEAGKLISSLLKIKPRVHRINPLRRNSHE